MSSPRKLRRLIGLLAVAVVATSAPAALMGGASAAPKDEYRQGDVILIEKNKDFDRAHGVIKGSGSQAHPYIISGWRLNHLEIHDTSRWVEIYDNQVTGQMILNWVGDRVNVYDNMVADLRVNQNIPRKGLPTSGKIVNNTFGRVGQLRHWNGLFAWNVVGNPDGSRSRQAMNFDGFNGGRLYKNIFYGYIDATLHGHNHSSSFADTSHDHRGRTSGKNIHRLRYHQVYIENNRVFSTNTYAIRYTDQNHAANDRTAASETDERLNEPHVHFTNVFIRENKLEGAGIFVDVFNADDPRHIRTTRGHFMIQGNLIQLADDTRAFTSWLDGILVERATDIDLHIAENTILGAPPTPQAERNIFDDLFGGSQGAGIRLGQVDKGDLYIHDNRVTRRPFGVHATNFSDSVDWWITNLRTKDVGQRVYYDESVAHEPNRDR
ncbi:MAG: hypothetical protein ACRDH6_02805 [Actinomycetota bacterium]